MPLAEPFGKFILLEQCDVGSLGLDFRAIDPSAAQPPAFFGLLKVSEALTREEKTLRRLITEAKVSAQLSGPNILKLLSIGKVRDTYFIRYPWHEGKSLKAVFRKSRREGFPLAVDHALLVAAKVARALELAHLRRFEGARYFHGSLFPSSVLLTYEGEVRIRGFGMWSALRDKARSSSRWGAEESLYLAPEQIERYAGDHRSDLFTLGAILFEMLTAHPYFESDRAVDFPGRVLSARLAHPGGGGRPLPAELVELLLGLLQTDPAARLAETAEARQRMEQLLFRGEFQPTTFNLAFFMHSLFRAEIDEEGRTRREEAERHSRTPAAEPTRFALGGRRERRGALPSPPATPAVPSSTLAGAAELRALEAVASGIAASSVPGLPAASPTPARASRDSGAVKLERMEPRGDTPEPVPERSSTRVLRLAAAILLFTAVSWVGYRYVRPVATSGLSATLKPASVAGERAPGVQSPPGGDGSPAPAIDYQAELARLREELEKSKEAELAAERERLRQEVRKEFEGKTDSLVAAELKRRQKELEDLYRRQQEEERKLIEQQLQARYQQEQESLRRQVPQVPQVPQVEEDGERKADPAPSSSPTLSEASAGEQDARALPGNNASDSPPTPLALPPPVSVGELVGADDPELVPPRPRKRVVPEYPPLAARQRAQAEVVVSALVGERGEVQDVRLLHGPKGSLGFDEAAIKAVMQYKFFPATKRGVPVRVWFNVIVRFTL